VNFLFTCLQQSPYGCAGLIMLSSCTFSKALEWLISLWVGKRRTRSELNWRLTVIIPREHLGVQRSDFRVLKTLAMI